MFNGSSAFYNQENKFLNTFRLKATLESNLIQGNTTIASPIRGYYSIREFNNNFLIADSDQGIISGAGASRAQRVFTYSEIGAGASSVNIGISIGSPIASPLQLLVEGNTANVFIHNIDRKFLIRLSSSDGINWGNTTTIMQGGSDRILAIAAMGSTYIYCFYDRFGVTNYEIVKFSQNGSTWNSYSLTYLNKKKNNINALAGNRPLVAQKYRDLDYLFYLDLDFDGVYDKGYNIYKLITDGLNTFEKKILFQGDFTNYYDSGSSLQTLNLQDSFLSEITTGKSFYYLGFAFNRGLVSVGSPTYSKGFLIYETKDFNSFKLKTGLSNIGLGFPYYNIYASAGNTNLNLMAICDTLGNTKSTNYLISGITSIDISNNIINYSNQNNRRISLTLGNIN